MIRTYYCAFCEKLRLFGVWMTEWAESVGYARAASELARLGKYEQARELMQNRMHKEK